MDKLRKFLRKIKYQNYKIIKKFPEGMSNDTFLIEHNSLLKVVRIPKKTRNKYLNKNNELFFLTGDEDVYYLDKKGYLITKYVEGTKYHNIYPLNDKYMSYIIDEIKKFHETNETNFLGLEEYNLIKEFNKLLKKLSPILDGHKIIMLTKFLEVAKYLNNSYYKNSKTIIHGDIQLNNMLLVTNPIRCHLLDFEYVTYGSIYFDLGALYLDTKYNLNKITQLYFGASSKDDNLAVLGGALIYAIRWFFIATLKAKDKNYNKDMNYHQISDYFFNEADRLYHEITNLNE